MVAKQVKLILFLALVLLAGLAQADEVMQDAMPILQQHQVCKSDSDCLIIQRHCGDCDNGSPVNRQYQNIYMKERISRCANFRGGVCDLAGPAPVPLCRAGICTTK